ncbi:hypothetical protein L1987_74002 [Smallanthus sonchifolius]|uniref:Uncharacterized protein n=1 Tax=Smallanthus sonchifolius TaxID=185202 RepID=A0ACB9A0V7_9ASTR|nr:hypothetical protein L1987_74002 [Smallanthus sonchifolius]
MEGIGSRTGRPSSRYGSAPVFTGPVRRWQKQWVHVSSSSSSVSYNNRSNSNNNNISSVRIRRWTPVPSAPSGGDSESVAEERPRRKLRYAPIVVLEGKKKEAEKSDVYVKETSKTSSGDEKKSSENVLAAKVQASQKRAAATKDLNNQPMDLDIGDDDEDEDHDLGGADKAADWVMAAQKGFAY